MINGEEEKMDSFDREVELVENDETLTHNEKVRIIDDMAKDYFEKPVTPND